MIYVRAEQIHPCGYYTTGDSVWTALPDLVIFDKRNTHCYYWIKKNFIFIEKEVTARTSARKK
jgi:hypothetical protein